MNIFSFLATSYHLFLSKALQQLQLQHLGSSWLAGSSTSACELFWTSDSVLEPFDTPTLCFQQYHSINNNKNAMLLPSIYYNNHKKTKAGNEWKTSHFLTWLKQWLINCTFWLLHTKHSYRTDVSLIPRLSPSPVFDRKISSREGLGTSLTDVTSFGCCRIIILDWIGTASSGKQLQMHTATGRLGQVGQSASWQSRASLIPRLSSVHEDSLGNTSL